MVAKEFPNNCEIMYVNMTLTTGAFERTIVKDDLTYDCFPKSDKLVLSQSAQLSLAMFYRITVACCVMEGSIHRLEFSQCRAEKRWPWPWGRPQNCSLQEKFSKHSKYRVSKNWLLPTTTPYMHDDALKAF